MNVVLGRANQRKIDFQTREPLHPFFNTTLAPTAQLNRNQRSIFRKPDIVLLSIGPSDRLGVASSVAHT